MSKYLPPASFALLIGILLIGQRFGFLWAGGEGYEPNLPIEILEVQDAEDGQADVFVTTPGREGQGLGFTAKRGQTLHTESGRALIQIGDTRIAVDERTDLEFVATTEDAVVLRMPRGRIYVDRPTAEGTFTLKTNYSESTFRAGTASFVNYDFREVVSVIPITGSISVTTAQDGNMEETQVPLDVHETEPVTRTNTLFNITEGAGAEFYAWALDALGL